MKKITCFLAAVIAMTMVFSSSAFCKRETVIKIGINAPLTGDIPKVGEGSQYAAQMWLSDVEKAGALKSAAGSTRSNWLLKTMNSKQNLR